jgi:predicted ATPase
MPRIVVTGGPGAGKTSLLLALQERGYSVVADSARAVIQNRRKRGLSPRPGPLEFAQQVLRIDIENFDLYEGALRHVFYDRGVLDALCMLHQVAPLTEADLHARLAQYHYSRKVFVLPPWREIYATDSERDQTFADAVAIHATTRAWYLRCGYELIEVPTGTLAERYAFVERSLAKEPG